MPELPEVEVIMRGVTPHLQGRTISRVSCSHHELRLPVPREKLDSLIQGAVVQEVRRRAKYLVVSMDNGATLVIHLGMTGNLGVFSAGSEMAKHDHLSLVMDSGMELRYNDTRRFGSIQVFASDDQERERFFGALGPEPFGDGFSAEYLMSKAKGRKQPLKNFLMDGRVVVGIGNIYASEILHAAAIRPSRRVGQVNSTTWQEIVVKSREILDKAIAAGGSTISDFVNSSGEKGYFQLSLQVYGRGGGECRRCGATIEKVVMAGRATFFCPACQA